MTDTRMPREVAKRIEREGFDLLDADGEPATLDAMEHLIHRLAALADSQALTAPEDPTDDR